MYPVTPTIFHPRNLVPQQATKFLAPKLIIIAGQIKKFNTFVFIDKIKYYSKACLYIFYFSFAIYLENLS